MDETEVHLRFGKWKESSIHHALGAFTVKGGETDAQVLVGPSWSSFCLLFLPTAVLADQHALRPPDAGLAKW